MATIVTVTDSDKANMSTTIESTCSQYNTPQRNFLAEMDQMLRNGSNPADALKHTQSELFGEQSQAMAINVARGIASQGVSYGDDGKELGSSQSSPSAVAERANSNEHQV